MIQTSLEKVDGGARLVGDAGKTMDDIVAAVKEVSSIISDISVASREQLSGIEQVNRAIMDMDGSTQQSAAMVEQSTAAAAQMADRARELVAAVARFRLSASVAKGAMPAHATGRAESATPPAARPVPSAPPVALPRHERRAATMPRQIAPQSGDGEWKTF